jgi:hypothetical protein
VSHRPAYPWIVALAFVVGLMLSGGAPAQVHRCTTADGRVTYTDKRCGDIGAQQAPPRPSAPGAVARSVRAAHCPRTVQDLIFEVTSAIDHRDANALAALYHWPGMSSDQGYRIVERLAAIAERPLVDVSPVMPPAPEGVDGELYPQTTVRQAPIGLRVEQTLANGSTPSRTQFGLRRHLDCLWISF